MKTKFKILAWLGLLLFIGLFVLYAAEFKWLENTFDAGELIWKSIAGGVLVGILTGLFLKKHAEDLVSHIRLWAACLLVPAFFAPLAGSLTNRLLTPHETQLQDFEFWEEKPYASELYGFIEGEKIEPDGYYLFILRNGEIKRFKSKFQRFKGVRRGDIIKMPVKKGLWGFEVVALQ